MSNEQFPESAIGVDTVVLYHKACNDGKAAAWAVWNTLGDTAIYLPYQYKDEWPRECKGMHVIMVDLSITFDEFMAINDDIKSLLIIDHHKSAQELTHLFPPVANYEEYLKERPQMEHGGRVHIDMEECGSVLAWRFFGNLPKDTIVPLALQMVNDYDLWKHVIPDTKSFNAWLAQSSVSIQAFNTQVLKGDEIDESVLEIGDALLAKDASIASSVVKNYVCPCESNKGLKYALVNGPHHLRNEISDLLVDKYDFVVVYNRRSAVTVVSLRGKKGGGVDLSALAKRYGGGGHMDAASFSFPHHVHVDLTAFADVKITFMDRFKAAVQAFKSPLGK